MWPMRCRWPSAELAVALLSADAAVFVAPTLLPLTLCVLTQGLGCTPARCVADWVRTWLFLWRCATGTAGNQLRLQCQLTDCW